MVEPCTPCTQQDLLREMSGDIKTLVTEFKNMNGSLKDTKKGFEEHQKESEIHRYRITITWFVMQSIKWMIGGGLLGAILLDWFKK